MSLVSKWKNTVDYVNPGAPVQFVRSFGRYRFEQPQVKPNEDAAYIFPVSGKGMTAAP